MSGRFFVDDEQLRWPGLHWSQHHLIHSCTVEDAATRGTSYHSGIPAIADELDHRPPAF